MDLFFYNEDQVTVFLKTATGIQTAVWKSDNPDYQKVIQLCKEKKFLEIELLNNMAKTIMTNKDVAINGNTLSVNGKSIDISESNNTLVNLIKVLRDNGTIESEIERVKPFLVKICDNAFIDAKKEMLDWLRAMDFEVTDDGCFLAYKKVRSDLGSVYDYGATKHKVGEYTEVKLYDTDRTKTCSCGLHFCSREYLKHYSGDKVIIVKVDPRDVVSIPEEYQYLKGRCRKYLTVKILEEGEFLDTMDLSTLDKSAGTVIRATNRIDETAELMKLYEDPEKVAEKMGISVETVKRNLRKHKAMHRG